jgi:recombination protein RecA
VIFINQLRQKIGVMYGNPETTPGGLALKYYSSVRIDVRRVEALKSGGEIIGNRTRAKVIKNKVAPPFKEAEFDIVYGEGISRLGEVVDVGVRVGVIDKAGAWFTCNGERLQGRDAVKDYLANNPDVQELVEQQIMEQEGTTNKATMKNAKKKSSASEEAPAVKAVDVTADDFEG